MGTPECLIRTRESYNKIRIETREKNTHEKKTHMSSRVIDYSKWDRLKYSSSSEEEEEEDDEGGKEMEIAKSRAALEKLSLSSSSLYRARALKVSRGTPPPLPFERPRGKKKKKR